jgi:hypothetical protein
MNDGCTPDPAVHDAVVQAETDSLGTHTLATSAGSTRSLGSRVSDALRAALTIARVRADRYSVKRLLALVFVLGLTAGAANADAGCGVVLGSDWAFAVATPARWQSLCQSGKPGGAALALWPQGTLLPHAPAVMSVVVNDKNRRSLARFAADEQQWLRSRKPKIAVRFEPGLAVNGSPALVFRVTDARTHQLIAYVEGPTRFFVVAISAKTTQSLQESRVAFQTMLNSFVPMRAVVQPSK